MRKNASFKIVFSIFSIVWTGVAILLISLVLPGIIQDYMVVNKGEKLEAVVTGAYEDTSYTENGKHYWYMTYQYNYEGKNYKGKTTSAYDENEVLEKDAVIEILYYDGMTIQADYTLSNSNIFFGIFTLISLAIGIGFGCAAIASAKKDRKLNKIKETGKRTTATYITSYSNLKVNNVPYYKIKYKYTDSYGIERTEESLGHCSRDEAEYLEALTEFQIAYEGGQSVIVEDFVNRKSLHEILERQEGDMEHVAPLSIDPVAPVKEDIKRECPNCGAVATVTSNGTCPYCGTQINR